MGKSDQMSKVTHVGLDCHRKFSTLSGRDAAGKVIVRQKLDHADRPGMREDLSRFARGTPVVLEGSFGWGWVCEELSAAGLEPHLASGSKVGGWRKARGLAKNNKLDADLLSEVWDEKQRWWEVWLPPVAVRDQRELLRYRMSLVRIQTGLKNRVHALLHRHGVLHEHSDLFGAAGRRFLAQLSADEDVTLREAARCVLRGYLKLLEELRASIARVTRQFRKEVKSRPEARRLMTLPGVSWVLAYTVLAEVGQIERFRNKRSLARYSCLAPLADDSGEDDGSAPIGRHVGHAGRRTLKWAWIEAAHGAVRHGGRFKAAFDRRTDGGKRDRNRGYIAVADDLCKLAYVLWAKEVDYTDDPPPRPGSRPAPAADKTTTTTSAPKDQAGADAGRTINASSPKDRAGADAGRTINASSPKDRAGETDSRSGTGQPDCTMARGRPRAAARSLCK